jgi:hypothetical protein
MSSLYAEEQMNNDMMPSMDFIVFLGEWETEEGEWVDPVQLDNDEIDKLIEITSNHKINNDIDNEN